jgi:Ca-activated chloride channel homolog
MGRIPAVLGTFIAALLLAGEAATAGERATIMVFDASGSMWNRMQGDITRIEVARDVMEEFFAGRDANAPISVIAYGHRRRGDCADIEVVAPLGVHDPRELAARVRALNPQGMTPLTDSLTLAREQIPRTAESADLILVTDGLENCGGDPCALAARLAAEGIQIRAHVVGFGMTAEEVNSLSCVPDQTGGRLFHTSSGVELAEALAAVSVPEPQPVELAFRAVDARNGEPLHPSDWQIHDGQTGALVASAEAAAAFNARLEDGAYRVSAVHPGFEGTIDLAVDAGTSGTIDVPLQKVLGTLVLQAVDARTGVTLANVDWTLVDLATEAAQTERAAGERHRLLLRPGDYRVEGISGLLTGGANVSVTLDEDVTARVELAEALADASVSAPAEIIAGARFGVDWAGPNDASDYVAIVEAGAPEGTSINYARTRFGSPAQVTAPDALGAYEVRYVHHASRRTLASQPVTLVAAGARLEAPDEAVAGAAIEVTWEGPDNPGDYIAVVEAGAPEGTNISYARTRFGSPAKITLPDALGTHELRYVINQSGRTLASRPITLVPASASLEAPRVIVPGGQIEVVWSGPNNPQDYITIVERGAAEGSHTDYWRTNRGSPARLRAPQAEGEYELRYVINQSRRTLAAVPVTVGAGDVSLAVEGEARAGAVVTVRWEGPGRFQDFIQIANEGSADDAPALREARASQGSPLQLFAPASAGRYELRYRASDSGEVLARVPLVVSD